MRRRHRVCGIVVGWILASCGAGDPPADLPGPPADLPAPDDPGDHAGTDPGCTLNVCGQCIPPPPESCDGQDEDCDGQVDEDIVDPGTPCPVQVGVCQGSRVICRGLAGWTCDAESYRAHDARHEVLERSCADGADNDCDGLADAADAQDCCTPPCGPDHACVRGACASTAGCEGVPPEGCCDGSLVRWCEDGRVRTLDCFIDPTTRFCAWETLGYYWCTSASQGDLHNCPDLAR